MGKRRIYLAEVISIMPSETKIDKAPSREEFHTSKSGEDNKLDRAAQEAAVKAGKTEKRYERDHDIFTK
jgi:hypothetical protein